MTATRKISLTGIHAINWYGYAESLPVAGNVLLAGVTGSGKSILMDLLQVVLVGDRRLVKFNQSATGMTSGRDLKGYCLGDLKEEEGGVAQYMRDSAITYAAIELTWPLDRGGPAAQRIETWGLRAEFASAAEQQGKVSPFWCEGALQRGDFLTVNTAGKRVPRELSDFRAFVNERGGEIFSGIEEYRRDMASPGHLNFDHGVLSRLLPTAMSFTFLRSFNEFCRLFILPADRLDVSDVTTSYRTFQRYQEELAALRAQLEALREIQDLFRRREEHARDAAVSQYLAAELFSQHAVNEHSATEEKLGKLRIAAEKEEARIKELDGLIIAARDQLESLQSLINQTAEGQLYSYIKRDNEEVVRKIAQLRQTGTSLESALENRARRARSWVKQIAALPLDLEAVAISALEGAISKVESGGLTVADETLRGLEVVAQKAASEVSRAARSKMDRIVELRRELGVLRDEIAALRLGRLPFPGRVLDALNEGLSGLGEEPPARYLCRLCEVKDERWRAAIEIAFARKFAIVVAPQHYDQAEQIYHQLRADQLGHEAGRESLINPAKALKLARPVKMGSLAEKIETQHPVVAALVSNLFGHLICVERREELRDHEHAILTDGFMSRGAFVERLRHYDNLPFVGERGWQQQRAWKEKQVTDREAEERKLRPIEDAVIAVQATWRELFENPVPLNRELTRISELPALQNRFAENSDKLNRIDRAQFDEIEQKRTSIAQDVKKWEGEWRELLSNQQHKDVQIAEGELKGAGEKLKKAREEFETVRNAQDYSLWMARIEELRKQTLAEFPVLEIAADKLRQRRHEYERQAVEARGDLHEKRAVFIQAWPKFNELPPHAADNTGFDRLLAKIDSSDIPAYEQKSREEGRKWEHLFREQVLEKLRAALIEVKNVVALLNTLLNKPIGNSRYFIEHRKNPEFDLYHDLLSATGSAGTEVFASVEDVRLRSAIQDFLTILVEMPDSVQATRLLDYRHYYEYDMHVEDTSLPPDQRRRISVDRQSGKFSGGENQSPYFIAILASYLRAYRRHDRYRTAPTLALVPIDEAFSKLSGERIADCIDALRQLDLQGVFSMSTGNIPYAFEKCDHLLVVSKEEQRVGRRLKVRNVAVSIARESEEGREFMRDFA
jgi:energy-coupling factor transporter ATP-binding protein EcfA2